jgi:hypothetical protein
LGALPRLQFVVVRTSHAALFVPVHYYFVNAMDLVWAKLKSNVALPASQVVRTIPRGTRVTSSQSGTHSAPYLNRKTAILITLDLRCVGWMGKISWYP